MGPDRDARPVLILTTLLLFSGFWSLGLGSRARITAPPGQGAEGAPTPSPEPSPAPAVQLLLQEQHVSGIFLLSSVLSLSLLQNEKQSSNASEVFFMFLFKAL